MSEIIRKRETWGEGGGVDVEKGKVGPRGGQSRTEQKFLW